MQLTNVKFLKNNMDTHFCCNIYLEVAMEKEFEAYFISTKNKIRKELLVSGPVIRNSSSRDSKIKGHQILWRKIPSGLSALDFKLFLVFIVVLLRI